MEKSKSLTVSDLAQKFGFEIIPDCPAATEAGYTLADRNNAQVWSGLGQDRYNFYYSAWSGSVFGLTNKASILVARKKSDGSLVYAVNTIGYNLDTAPSYLGSLPMTCRTTPTIFGDYIFLTSGTVTSIGAQLYCLSKKDGSLLWAIAYALPDYVQQQLGVQYTTTRANYSQFSGSNAQLSDLNTVVFKNCKEINVLVGVSSLQNVYNPGLFPGVEFIGYPYYTEQGGLYCVTFSCEDPNPKVKWSTITCAPTLKVGDTLIKDPTLDHRVSEFDPFMPGQNSVLIATLAPLGGTILSPGAINGLYAFTQRVLTNNIPITAADIAPFWGNIGVNIVLSNDPTNVYDLAGALAKLSVSTGTVFLTTAISSIVGVVGTTSSGQFGVYYVKELFPGDKVLNKYDANGLGYWGNSTWGASPHLQLEREAVFFGCGQNHAIPLSERLYYSDPTRNYRGLKVPLVDAITNYLALPSANKLNAVNTLKESFMDDIRTLALAPARSPRGQMSYADGIFGVSSNTGRLLFAIRTVPCDVYTFLPVLLDFQQQFLSNDIDGDVSSGIWLTCEDRLLTVSKAGTGVSIETKCLTRACFNHYNLAETGVVVNDFVYVSPNGYLGGENYSSAFDGEARYGVEANDSSRNGSTGSSGQTEVYITKQGDEYPIGKSFVAKFDGKVIWTRVLEYVASGNIAVNRKNVFVGDAAGNFYALENESGEPVWFLKGSTATYPSNGGITTPLVLKDRVIWISAYQIPTYPASQTKYGAILQSDPTIAVPPCEGLNPEVLNEQVFVSGSDVNIWRTIPPCDKKCGGEGLFFLQVITENYTGAFPFTVCGNDVTFGDPIEEVGDGKLQYVSAQFFNLKAYLVTYIDVQTHEVFQKYFTYSNDNAV